MFKNLKSDAVPRAPRPAPNESNEQQPENDENIDSNNDPGITIEEIDDEDIKKEEKAKFKKSFFGTSKKKDSFKPKKDKNDKQKGSKIYTQGEKNVQNHRYTLYQFQGTVLSIIITSFVLVLLRAYST